MQIPVKQYSVEPVTVHGNGVPFSPRTMWKIVVTPNDGATWMEKHEPYVFWSRKVAELYAYDRSLTARRMMRDIIANLALTG